MEEDDLKQLLLSRTSRRGWGCPGEAQLAAFADQRLSGAARHALEAHLADCRFCLEQVSFLAQSAGWPEPAPVPAQLLAGARNLAAGKSRTATLWGWRWAATAAAVCIFLTAGFLVALRLRETDASRSVEGPLVAQVQRAEEAAPAPQSSPSPAARSTAAPTENTARARSTSPGPKPARPTAPTIRRAEVNGLSPKLLSPRDGAVLRRGELEFRWQPVADAVFYEVFVVTAAGDLVLERKSEGARLRLPADDTLAPGAKYFVWVRAYLREGRTAKSGVVSFRIAD